MSPEEKRLAHLGYLPCTASTTFPVPSQAPTPVVPCVVSGVPPSLQHLLALTEALSNTLPNAAATKAIDPAGSGLDAASSLRAAKIDDYLSKMLEQGYKNLAAFSLAKAKAHDDTDAADADDEPTITTTPSCGFYRYIPSSAYNGSVASEVVAARAAEEAVASVDLEPTVGAVVASIEPESKKQRRPEEKKKQVSECCCGI